MNCNASCQIVNFILVAHKNQSKFGWTNPLKGSELLHFSVGKHILFGREKRRENVAGECGET